MLVVAGDTVGTYMAGPGIRALETARALVERGLDVRLAVPGRTVPDVGLAAVAYDPGSGDLRASAAHADAVVLGGLSLARMPFLGALDRPLVVDLYAPFVLENLAAAVAGSPATPGRVRRHAGDVAAMTMQLERGDFFVCASEKQRDYYLGALTTAGRVNPDTYADDPTLRRLIDVVPFGVPEAPPVARGPVLRGVVPGIGSGDRIVLWAGGLWDWLDPLTPIRAVAELARVRDEIRLLFLGTRSPSPDVPAMAAARAAEDLARALGLLDRVVFFNHGWVPYAERSDFLLEADVGVSFHRPHVETDYAFRTRLLDYLWTGLPMLVTSGDVLSERVAQRDLGRVVPPGDVGAAVSALAALLDAPGGKASFAARFAAVRADFTWSRAVEPLAAFLATARRASDRPRLARAADRLAPTPAWVLPRRALEALREGGPLLMLEETARYVRWRRRPRGRE